MINKLVDFCKNNKLFKIGLLSLLASILIRAINLISVPIFSRLFTPSEYGQVDIFLTYVNIFVVLIGLDFQAAVGKGRLDYKDDADEYVSSSIIFSVVVFAFWFLICNLFYSQLYTLLSMNKWLMNVMLVYSFSMFLMTYKSCEFNFYFEYKKNMIMSVSVAFINVLLSVILVETVFREEHVVGRVVGACIPSVICAGFLLFHFLSRGKWKFRIAYVIYSVKYGVPLIPHNLSHLILGSADRLMIKATIGATESGIYSLAYTMGVMIQVVSEGMNQVFGPWLFRKLDKKDFDIVTFAQRAYVMIYCIPVVCVLAISPEIIMIFGPRDYWDGRNIIIWVVFATYINFVYTVYVNIEFFYKTTALISTGTIMAAIINIVLNCIYLPIYGYYFGAISTVISYVALLIFHMIIVNCIIKQHIVDNVFIAVQVLCMFGYTLIVNMFISSIVARIVAALIAIMIISVCLRTYLARNSTIKVELWNTDR